jgi:DNA-binding MarR family transcriptional regulator
MKLLRRTGGAMLALSPRVDIMPAAAGPPVRRLGVTLDITHELRLGFLIHDVSRLRRQLIDRVLKPLGVTRSQWWVLAFLSRRDGMTQVALADELELGPVALGALLDRLDAASLIQRRLDANDRRVRRVYLSKKGGKLIGSIRESVSVAEKRLLDGVRGKDIEAMARALRTMKSNILELLAVEDEVAAAD